MELLTKQGTHNNSTIKIIAAVLFIILPFAGFYLGKEYQKLTMETENNASYVMENKEKSVRNIKNNNNTTAYKLLITNPKKTLDEYLEIKLSQIFSIKNFSKENFIVYVDDGVFNKTGVKNWYINNPIFVLIKGESNKLENKTYESEYFSVKVEEDQFLIPYIEDNKFCIQDSECSVRYHWCLKGAWNKYTPYHSAIGCQYGDNEGMTKEIEVQYKQCDSVMGTGIIADYSGSKCVNNKCIALNPTFRCSKETQDWVNDAKKLGNN